MSKLLVLAYTQLEIDTITGKSRVVKHWQKIQNQEQRKKIDLVSDEQQEEYMD